MKRDPQTYAIIGAGMEVHKCFDDVIVEIKAIKQLSGTEESQIINYLKASGFKRGLLLNFGSSSLEYKRFVY